MVYLIFSSSKIGSIGSTHEHADFKIYINGQALNFAHEEYMVKVREVHIEDMIGTKIHKHATGITLRYFLETLGFEFNDKCFILDSEIEYCNNEKETLKFYVNEKENKKFGNYEIIDGDRYLISYGDDSEEEIQKQLNSLKEI